MNLDPITIAPVFPWWLILVLFCLALVQAAIQGVVNWSKLGRKKALVISTLRLAAIVILALDELEGTRQSTPQIVSLRQLCMKFVQSAWNMELQEFSKQANASEQAACMDVGHGTAREGMYSLNG